MGGPRWADKGPARRWRAPSLPPSVRPEWSIGIKAQTMSQLVECVPNFSEGNNQEVRCWGAKHVAQGREKGGCLIPEMQPLPVSPQGCAPGALGLRSGRRARKRLWDGQAGRGPGPGSGPQGCWKVPKPYQVGSAIIPMSSLRKLRHRELVQATEGHKANLGPEPQPLGCPAASESSGPFMARS